MTNIRYLVIDKKDDVYLKIEADESIRRDLGEFFTFEVPGFKFMPQYRARQWDGKIRLFSYQTGQIYAGLYPYVLQWCKDNEVEVVDGTKITETKVDDDKVDKFIEALKIPFKVRDYQKEAFVYATRQNRCLLLSPTASGKSLITYLLVRFNLLRLKESNKKILIIVPTTSLVEQLFKDFKDYGWSPEKNVHRIYQGHAKETNKSIIISTWQSIYKFPKRYFDDIDCVIGDEAHLFKSKSLTGIMTKLHNAKYRFGFTGTLDGSKTHKWVLEGLFGSCDQVTKTDDLIKSGYLSKFRIKILLCKHSSQHFETYHDEIDYLVENKGRNNLIKNLVRDLEGNTLVLFNYVEKHGEPLYDLINSNVKEDRKVFFVHGGTEVVDREEVRQITEEEDNAVIVASYGTFSTGINIKRLHNIIFASPSKSRIRNLQSIGRVLRKGEGNSIATLYDIADDIGGQNYTLRHLNERVTIYNEENFKYEVIKINLKAS